LELENGEVRATLFGRVTAFFGRELSSRACERVVVRARVGKGKIKGWGKVVVVVVRY
jgi:hypothetical protein